MPTRFTVGERVQWRWLGRIISGKVEEVYLKPVVRIIKEKKIKRNGSPDRPAYLVRSDAGNLALKLESEIEEYVLRESAWIDE